MGFIDKYIKTLLTKWAAGLLNFGELTIYQVIKKEKISTLRKKIQENMEQLI